MRGHKDDELVLGQIQQVRDDEKCAEELQAHLQALQLVFALAAWE